MTNESSRTREPIAIVGISALCPGSTTTDGFLRVIFEGEDQIRDVPLSRFSLTDYFDPDPRNERDKTYCRRGAFIEAVPFDPMEYGIPPSVIAATDSSQLLTLMKSKEVLQDARADQWTNIQRERISVILGTQGMTQLQARMMARTMWPDWIEEMNAAGVSPEESEAIAQRIAAHQPAWQEMSFPGFLGNIIAGRVTNRMDFGGTNYIVDAACASSLAAMSAALNELYLHQCDLAITGGVDLLTDIGSYVSFSKSMALSRSGDCRPFSKNADGTVIGEGIVLFALRRLADAERDGDPIHAVIRGHGTSSDGRGSAIYAPRREGQVRAMRRTYEAAGYGPETVGLVEAHGTGTPLGDTTEILSMTEVFASPEREAPCALGSVKSQIGHAKTSAGAVALLKVSAALRHGILPPTLKVDEPNEALTREDCPFYLSGAARPWISGTDHPRRASLSAFGFGGTNAHLTVEEYVGPGAKAPRRLKLPSQLLLFGADSLKAVLAAAEDTVAQAARGVALDGLAQESQRAFSPGAAHRLALVGRGADDLKALLAKVSGLLNKTGSLPGGGIDGAAYATGPTPAGKIAFVFPGQGSQYVGMTGDVAMHFDAARAVWDSDAKRAAADGATPLHEAVFPVPARTPEGTAAQEAALRATETAQPSLGASSLSLLTVLDAFGVRPDMTFGHSFGEIMALHAAGAFSAETALKIARQRGILMSKAGNGQACAMTAIVEDGPRVEALIKETGADVVIANHNAPRQVVISGLESEVEKVEKALKPDGFRRLPVSSAFHSPIVAPCAAALQVFLEDVWTTAPTLPVFANVGARPYGTQMVEARETLARQIASPVQFVDCVDAAYEAGARIFVEVGASDVLTGLVGKCLAGRNHAAIALDSKKRNGVAMLLQGLGRLSVHGVPVNYEALWADRRVDAPTEPVAHKKHVVWIDSTMNRVTEADRLAAASAPIKPVASAVAPTANGAGAPSGADHTPRANGAAPDGFAQPGGTPNGQARSATPGRAAVPPSAPHAKPVVDFKMREPLPPSDSPTRNSGDGAAVPAAASNAAPQAKPRPQLSVVPPLTERGGAPRQTAISPAPHRTPILPARSPVTAAGIEQVMAEVNATQELFLNTMVESHRAFLDLARSALGVATDPAQAQPPRPDIDVAATPAPLPGLGAVIRQAPNLAPAAAPAFADARPASAPADKLQQAAPATAPARAPQPAAQPQAALSAEDLTGIVLGVIAEKTGYPVEMLEGTMQLEGDLGVDSIRRVEIFMALRDRMPSIGDPTPEDQAVIARLATIQDIVDFLKSIPLPGAADAPAPQPAAADLLQPQASAPAEARSSAEVSVVPPAPAAAPTAAASPAPALPGAEELSKIVLEIIAEKTGYPTDLLGLEMELEADLGVDSIKRMEILMALRDRVPGALADPGDVDLTQIAALRTLDDVLNFLMKALEGGKDTAPSTPAAQPAAPETAPQNLEPLSIHLSSGSTAVDSFALTLHGAAAQGTPLPGLATPARIALIPDDRGVAEALQAALQARGCNAVIGLGTPGETSKAIFLSGLSTAAGPDAALPLHLSAFQTAKAMAGTLSEEGGVFVTVQDTGGTFGLGSDPGDRGWLGGLAGITKTVARCFPGIAAKTIDIASAGRSPTEIAEAIADELFTGNNDLEVALDANGRRWVPALVPMELSARDGASPEPAIIDERSVIAVSGGARGVTAACLEALAGAYRPRFVILSRTPLLEEPADLADAGTDQAIKRVLLERARSAGEAPKPAEVGRQAAAILAMREVRTCLARLEALGSEVLYIPSNVRSSDEVLGALAEARAKWGPITGIVHAAGVLADKRIPDKTAQQFTDVFETKVSGLAQLLAATVDDPLKFIVTFSSVAGRYGNIGQVDYAAANEVLNKVAQAEARRRAGACRVVSINWGAWDGGMVSPELARHMQAASLELIPLADGAKFLSDLLGAPKLDAVELVVTAASNLALLSGETPVTVSRPSLGIAASHAAE